MAFQGDLKTYSFPDLLQWLESSRKGGRLTLLCGGLERVLYLRDGVIESYGAAGLYDRLARAFRLLSLLDEHAAHAVAERAHAGGDFEQAAAAAGIGEKALRPIARDEAFQAAADLFEDSSGSFHFSDDLDAEGDERVRVEMGLREVVYEAARRLDEASAAVQAIPNDSLAILPGTSPDEGLSPSTRAAWTAVGQGTTVGALRLALGFSRAAAARVLQELWRAGHVQIVGAQELKPDPLTRMLRQGERLLADGHFDAATLMCTSLLSTDPSDRRVRDFARAVEREHTDALFRKLLPMAVPQVVNHASIEALRPDERIVAVLVNGRWDVSTLVLASPLRELQTLRALERMVELGFATLS